MTSLCDLQMLILLSLFATASLLQRSKKALEESCSRIIFGPSLEKQQFVSRLVLACNESEVDESPPGTKETGEVFGVKQLNKEKGSNQAHCDTSSGWNAQPTTCPALTGAVNQLQTVMQIR